MKRNGVVVWIRISNAVQAKFVRHVGDFVFIKCSLDGLLQRDILGVVQVDGGPGKACFNQLAFENLHNAVRIGMTKQPSVLTWGCLRQRYSNSGEQRRYQNVSVLPASLLRY